MALRPHSFPDQWEKGSILIHGTNNVGKTRLAMDALRYWHEKTGRKVLFANFMEENGTESGLDLGLDEATLGYPCIWDLSADPKEGLNDFKAFIELCLKEKPVAIGFDSLRAAYNTILASITGGERPPVGADAKTNEWSLAHVQMNYYMTKLRNCADNVICTCPSDTGRDELKRAETGLKGSIEVIPDLNGAMARKCMTWFTLVGYLMADSVRRGPKWETIRTLSFTPSSTYRTRQRLPYVITDTIRIPDRYHLWEPVQEKINSGFRKPEIQKPQSTEGVR